MRRFFLCFTLLIIAATSTTAQTDPVASINSRLAGQVVTIRNFPSGSLLRYDANGRLLEGGQSGPWTVFDQYEFGKANLHNRTLRISGERLAILFPHHDLTRKYYGFGEAMIEVDFPQPPDAAAVANAVNQVFLSKGMTLADAVPSCWRPLLTGEVTPKPLVKKHKQAKNSSGSASALVDADLGEEIRPGVYRVGKDVKPPKTTSAPEPLYDPIARAARMEGTMVLQAVVDERGEARDIAIVTPLAFGLDDRACEAVAAWKFAPATKNGVPVKVAVNVEVNFHLY